MNEFSPTIVGGLGPLLKVIATNEGDRGALVEAIVKSSPALKPVPGEQHLNRGNNVLIGMKECGLFDLKTNRLTEFGAALAKESKDATISAGFAQHLLANCHGNDLLDVVRSLALRREAITGDSIRSELRARGFQVTTNEGNAFKIRLWLEQTGVIDNKWRIDEDRYRAITGIATQTRDEWRSLTKSQQAFLLTLRQLTSGRGSVWVPGSHVRELCLAQWGDKILPEGSLRQKVIRPLEKAQWIESRGKGEGRGGKLGEIRSLPKLLEIASPLQIEHDISGIPRDLIKKLDTPLDIIYEDLDSKDVHRKGLALELLCLKLCLGLGLRPMAFRKRGEKTRGAEVDLIADGVHLHYSRWMFQCKNTPGSPVDLEDLAKEVGLAVLLRAHVVVMATTGRFARTIRDYAEGAAAETHLQVVMLDGDELKRVRAQGEARLVDTLKDQAREALSLKRPQVLEILKADEG
jgi:hypothetical protein